MKTTLTAYLVLALLAGCKGTERLPERSDPRPGLENPGRLLHSEPGNQPRPAGPVAATPPAVPAKPTRREYKAYKRQLDAWEAAQKAEAAARTAPKKLGKGSVYAPAATEVVSSYKPKAPVVKADSGAQVAVSKQAPAVAGNGNQVPTENNTGLPWWPFAVVAVGAGLLVFRKHIPFLS